MKSFCKCTVLKVKYKNTSLYGNSSYWLSFLDYKGHFERGYTAPNAGCGYTIQNYKYAEGKPIYLMYHYTNSGRCIIDRIQHILPSEAEKYANMQEGGIK